MQVIKTVAQMKESRYQVEGSVGFVPTMGFLHEGHVSLVERSVRDNEVTIASIFVNPTQFGPSEDFESYPRDTERDLAMLKAAGTDIVFMPEPLDMYPEGFASWVEVGDITSVLEGASRPTHFRGVTTVVAKLFNIVRPDRAYFGQKDAQQLAVISKMVKDLDMNLEVVRCPTVREPDGLAMSSRNSYLEPGERETAPVLYQSLLLAEKLWKDGENNAETIRQKMKELISEKSVAEIDYISIADALTLKELDNIEPPALVSLAVKIGKPRLIDNTLLE